MAKRTYTLKKRAKRQEETRGRIVEATVELHEKLGPRNTTISAIAERAGVQRLTVYRHFPTEKELFAACTSHFLGRYPPPDPGAWNRVEDPADRTRAALTALYSYYRETEAMWAGAYRDREEVPAMEEPMARFDAYLEDIRHDLARAWKAPPGETAKQAGAVLGLAVRLCTWQSLGEEGLSDTEMAKLVTGWVESGLSTQNLQGVDP